MNLTYIPILMYHSIQDKDKKNNSSLPHTTTITVEDFKNQISYLIENEYKSISVGEFFSKAYNTAEAKKLVCITFDDGFLSTLEYAAPILKKAGLSATLFVPINPIGKSSFKNFNGFEHILDDRPLTWEEILNLKNEGWDLQSHGMNHQKMSLLTSEDLEIELGESKRILEEKVQRKVKYFAYPFGDYDARTLKAVEKTGYEGAFSVHVGKAIQTKDTFRLPRIEINNKDTISTFERKLKTGYNSRQEMIRSKLRDVLYSYPTIKDLIKGFK